MLIRYRCAGLPGFATLSGDHDAYCRLAKGRYFVIARKSWRHLKRAMKVAERQHRRSL